MSTDLYFLLCFLNLTLLWPVTTIGTQKIYSLVTDLEPLLLTQKHVIEDLKNVLNEKKKLLHFVRRETIRFRAVHKKAKEDVRRYFENKINNFTYIKRMTIDLNYIKNVTQQRPRLTRNKTLKYPTYEDLDEAVRVVLRLQRVYLLNISQLADGLLKTAFSGDGTIYREKFSPMTTSDCFELSKVLYNNKFHKIGIQWLQEALRLSDKQKSSLDVTEVDILSAISNGYSTLNNSAQYIVWTKKLLDLNPPFDEETIRDLQVKVDIHQLRINERIHKENLQKNKKNKPKQQKKKKLSEKERQRKAFRVLCRGEMLIGHDISKKLKCWFFTGHHPFSRLAPFKAEQLFIRPDIFLIHDALSDTEIQTIKNISLPELSVIPTQHTDNSSSMHVRLSKGMQFNKTQSRSVVHLTRRLSHLTGLRTTSHLLTISNYGVGGHYVIHTDSSDWIDRETLEKEWKLKHRKKSKKKINACVTDMSQFFRISTVLFYMSTVEQGGATVFPLLGLSVFPIKGAALVWDNLLPTGKSDILSMHGACPVLRGSKWVATKWIDGANQELRRPCTNKYTSRKPADIKPVFKEPIFSVADKFIRSNS